MSEARDFVTIDAWREEARARARQELPNASLEVIEERADELLEQRFAEEPTD